MRGPPSFPAGSRKARWAGVVYSFPRFAQSLFESDGHPDAMHPDAITNLPPLPALRHLGELANRLPVIVCDTREQEPLPIRRLPVVRAGLYTGDYSLAGLETVFAVERKSIPDIVSCCAASNRARLKTSCTG